MAFMVDLAFNMPADTWNAIVVWASENVSKGRAYGWVHSGQWTTGWYDITGSGAPMNPFLIKFPDYAEALHFQLRFSEHVVSVRGEGDNAKGE